MTTRASTLPGSKLVLLLVTTLPPVVWSLKTRSLLVLDAGIAKYFLPNFASNGRHSAWIFHHSKISVVELQMGRDSYVEHSFLKSLKLLAVFDFLLSRFLNLEVGDSSISVKLESLSSICAELVLTDLLTFSSRYFLVSSSLLNWSRWIPLNFRSITSYHNYYILIDPLFL